MPPGLHIDHARIWTGDPARPWADSLTIGPHGDVTAVGESRPPPRAAIAIRGRGCVLTPGLIDSHMHLLMGGRSLGEVDLSHVRSREEFERAIATAHAQLPPDRWLVGRGWCEQNWLGHAMPNHTWLAQAGARPCVCYRMDVHAMVVNEVVLQMIDAAGRDDPPGGRIVRDASGKATGLLQESAAWELVNPLIPEPDIATKRKTLLAAQRHCHALGLTAVGSMELASDVENVFRPVRDGLTLRCMITLLDRPSDERSLQAMSFDFGRTFAGDTRLNVIGYKTFIDGTMGSRTARMLHEYADDPGNRGMLVELAAADCLKQWVRSVSAAGHSPSMHAIGDEAARLALDAIDSLPVNVRRAARPRIEHAQQLDPADIARFGGGGNGGDGGGVIASMQPLHKADDGRYLPQRLGPDRVKGSFAFRSLRDAGAILAFGSDWPVVSCDPILGMRAAITGLTLDEQPFVPEQNLTVEQALRAYTRDAAYCLSMARAGVLTEGMHGDCVMFDIDPFTADWVHRPPRVIMTIAGGEVVFDAT